MVGFLYLCRIKSPKLALQKTVINFGVRVVERNFN